jgi:hypothetical protein
MFIDGMPPNMQTQTFKNHFVAILCGADQDFPLHLWNRLVQEQAELTLNLLCSSRMQPQLSACAHLNGNFDYNHTPLAPLGTKMALHEKPAHMPPPHGLDGWCIGPAMGHHRCYRVHINSSQAEHTGDAINFFPTTSTMPTTSSADLAIIVVRDLIHTLKNPAPALPLGHVGDQQLQALKFLAIMFDRVHHQVAPTTSSKPEPGPIPAAPWRVVDPKPEKMYGAKQMWVEPPTRRHSIRSHLRQANALIMHAQVAKMATTPPDDNLFGIHPMFPHLAQHAVINTDTRAALEHRHLIKNNKTRTTRTHHSFANELRRLAQGIGALVKGTDTIFSCPSPRSQKIARSPVVELSWTSAPRSRRLNAPNSPWGAISCPTMPAPKTLTSPRPRSVSIASSPLVVPDSWE